MEKALEILEEIDEVVINKYHKTKDITFHENDILFIKEAIAELKEAMKPKTCADCKHRSNLAEYLTNTINNGFCVENGFFTKHGFCCNRYETKDKA